MLHYGVLCLKYSMKIYFLYVDIFTWYAFCIKAFFHFFYLLENSYCNVYVSLYHFILLYFLITVSILIKIRIDPLQESCQAFIHAWRHRYCRAEVILTNTKTVNLALIFSVSLCTISHWYIHICWHYYSFSNCLYPASCVPIEIDWHFYHFCVLFSIYFSWQFWYFMIYFIMYTKTCKYIAILVYLHTTI